MDDRPDCWEFSWIEVPTYTTATTHEGLRSKLAEGWEPFQVVPMTTGEAMTRSDENFSAWADFKEWMDVAFAGALMPR